MFEVEDRVQIVVEGDPFNGQEGEVVEVYGSVSQADVRILLDTEKEQGSILLWFGSNEIRKVEA
ncbi:hypothetical protein ABZ353_10845 [Streptomyces niveus]|uniref:hypothetical protein n=1 Tax=Streptomyces niveus TaxID=193462 RepID=UPI0033ED27C4